MTLTLKAYFNKLLPGTFGMDNIAIPHIVDDVDVATARYRLVIDKRASFSSLFGIKGSTSGSFSVLFNRVMSLSMECILKEKIKHNGKD